MAHTLLSADSSVYRLTCHLMTIFGIYLNRSLSLNMFNSYNFYFSAEVFFSFDKSKTLSCQTNIVTLFLRL